MIVLAGLRTATLHTLVHPDAPKGTLRVWFGAMGPGQVRVGNTPVTVPIEYADAPITEWPVLVRGTQDTPLSIPLLRAEVL